MQLDVVAAERAIARLAATLDLPLAGVALGIVDIANENMIAALRLISVERGHDPRTFSLCCFGGAGGMHVCALADALGITRILLPPAGSVFSALGMLQASPSRQLTRTICRPVEDVAAQISSIASALAAIGRDELAREGVPLERCEEQISLDLRYLGQSYYLNLRLPADDRAATQVDALTARFHALHTSRYGHNVQATVELVNIRVRLHGPAPMSRSMSAAVFVAQLPTSGDAHSSVTPAVVGNLAAETHERHALGAPIDGPAIVTEAYTCTWIAPGWRATPAGDGTLTLLRL